MAFLIAAAVLGLAAAFVLACCLIHDEAPREFDH